MPNKAIHQLPNASNVQDGDVIYIVRSSTDYSVLGANMPPRIRKAVYALSSADVLDLHDTPIEVIAAPAAGTVIVPLSASIQFSGGSADYDTNTTLVLGSTSTVGDSTYALAGSIADRTIDNACYAASGTTLAPIKAADGLSVYVLNGDPANGDSDITLTVWYQVLSV